MGMENANVPERRNTRTESVREGVTDLCFILASMEDMTLSASW